MGRRAVITALGASPLEAIENNLRLEDQPEPVPGDGEAVVAIKSANIGWVDLLMASGQYQHVPDPPYTPGLELAGVVAAIGADVSAVRVGDRVLTDGLSTGPRSLGPYRSQGGFASFAIAPATALIPLPPGYDFDEGACLLSGAETAYHALVHRGRLQSGETALILGATGSTGLAAVSLAKLIGAKVIAVGRTAAKLEVAKKMGADHSVTTDTPLKDQIKALTHGRGADVIYDPVGGELSTEALRAAAFGARFVVVGWASTPLVARGGRDPNTLPTNLILMKSIDVLGSPAAISVHRDPSLRTERLSRILAWANAGELRPHISAHFTFDTLQEALRQKWSGQHPGNIVLHPR